MGTNYYLMTKACEHCGRGNDGEGVHIGKASFGWAFMLHVYPDGVEIPNPNTGRVEKVVINDLDDWRPLFALGVINGYGEIVTLSDMVNIITKRSHPTRPLHRHEASPHRCLGPGAGTWDRLIGDFS